MHFFLKLLLHFCVFRRDNFFKEPINTKQTTAFMAGHRGKCHFPLYNPALVMNTICWTGLLWTWCGLFSKDTLHIIQNVFVNVLGYCSSTYKFLTL